ncbi:lipopolysaccharide biosynthesis protein [Pararhizobium sp.]|uniref:lipopolysaccharide biosynthesis protein n=1 Tax=Pararhizobium sp. TaxID=1977563 RepID=UPI00271F9266|nr:lipopolysaccharide biosynthesis protein [Pararhizobium sp.]MDO9418267.1 lipopolysaccharide biosynthesis protein [Pararhizobium sp.]
MTGRSSRAMQLVSKLYVQYQDVVRAYLSMIGGSVGRLVLSLVYFVCIANVMSIGDFGLFATASATGVMVSRALAFGFMSPLYRVATVKPLLLGTYSLGFLASALLSLPLIALLCTIAYLALFSADMAADVFFRFMVAEIICWRGLETVSNVLNGLGRFGRSAIMVVIGMALRTATALAFLLSPWSSLDAWSGFYLASNVISVTIAIIVFYPRVRLRWKPSLYMRRWADSVSVAGAEILFYVQSEFDKLVVLAIGGPAVSGIYAIIMRLADLTALPVRSFNMLLVQNIMRSSAVIQTPRTRAAIELAIAAVSFLAIGSMGLYLWIIPAGLGRNVAEVSPYVLMVLFVPGFRNLIEYHSELLYATGRTVRRMFNLLVICLLKVALLAGLMKMTLDPATWVPDLNALYLGLYLVSLLLTYPAMATLKPRAI